MHVSYAEVHLSKPQNQLPLYSTNDTIKRGHCVPALAIGNQHMKNITRHTGPVKLIERLPNSYNGNPQFILGIMDTPNKGLGWTFRTPKDSMLGYEIQNYIDKDIDVTVTIGTKYNCTMLNSLETA